MQFSDSTIENKIESVLQKALSSVLPAELSNMASGPLMDILRKTVPDEIAKILSTKVEVGTTGYQRYTQREENNIDQIAGRTGSKYASQAMKDVLSSIYRSLETEKAWLERNKSHYVNEAEAKRAYESYINTNVEGLANNKILQQIYPLVAPMLGLGDPRALSANMSTVIQNLVDNGSVANSRVALATANRAAKFLFDGDITFNSTVRSLSAEEKKYDRLEWGGFRKEAVAEIAAAVTEGVDITDGATKLDLENVKSAAERLRKLVRDTTRALEPLRDVFGNDIKGMIDALEGITGNSLGRVAPERITAAVRQLHKAGTNGIGVETFTEKMSAAEVMLAQTDGLAPLMYNSAGALGLNIATLERRGSPGFLNATQASAAATRRAIDTHTSDGAEYARLSYGMWAERMNKGALGENTEYGIESDNWKLFKNLERQLQNGEITQTEYYQQMREYQLDYYTQLKEMSSVGAFEKELKKVMSTRGMNPLQAMMHLAGVGSLSQLNAGYATAGYAHAVNDEGIGRLINEVAIKKEKNDLVDKFRNSESLQRTIGVDFNSARDPAQEAGEVLNKVFELVENTDITTVATDDLEQYLENKGVENHEQVAKAYRYLISNKDKRTQALITNIHQLGSQKRVVAREKRATRLRSLVEEYEGVEGESALLNLIDNGFDFNKISSEVDKVDRYNSVVTEDKEELQALLLMTRRQVDRQEKRSGKKFTKEERDKAMKKALYANLDFHNSSEAASSDQYQDSIQQIRKSQLEIQKIDKEWEEYGGADYEKKTAGYKNTLNHHYDLEALEANRKKPWYSLRLDKKVVKNLGHAVTAAKAEAAVIRARIKKGKVKIEDLTEREKLLLKHTKTDKAGFSMSSPQAIANAFMLYLEEKVENREDAEREMKRPYEKRRKAEEYNIKYHQNRVEIISNIGQDRYDEFQKHGGGSPQGDAELLKYIQENRDKIDGDRRISAYLVNKNVRNSIEFSEKSRLSESQREVALKIYDDYLKNADENKDGYVDLGEGQRDYFTKKREELQKKIDKTKDKKKREKYTEELAILNTVNNEINDAVNKHDANAPSDTLANYTRQSSESLDGIHTMLGTFIKTITREGLPLNKDSMDALNRFGSLR